MADDNANVNGDGSFRQVALMFKNTSATGNVYFSGTTKNGVKLMMFKSKKLTKKGTEMWNLMEPIDDK